MMQAIIIPFPATSPASREQDRLRRSLENLQSALAEQKRTLGDWRSAMTELSVGVAGLGHAMGNYQRSLSGVETRLGGLRSETEQMQGWVGSVAAQ